MDKKRRRSIIINFIIIILFVVSALSLGPLFSNSQEITYNEFLTMVEQGKVDKVKIGDSQIELKVLGDNTTYYTGYIEYNNLVDKLQESGVTYEKAKSNDAFGTILLTLLINFGPFLILLWIFSRFMSQQSGGGGILSVGKSKAKLAMDSNTNVTFEDVAGQEEAKEQLTEIIDFLHNPQKYQEIGAKIPKGALLVGPPGTGKTLLAKAVAGEAHVPFYSVSGSDFIEMYVGVGASRIRDLFEQAKKNAPCIIFIDEVDSIAKTRDGGYKTGSNDERDQTLNQLLSEMDGFDSSKGIIILAATNRPDILDKAFLRAGRFDRKVIVERPDFKGRVDTLKVHTRNVKIDDSVDFNAIAHATTGSVGADLENIVNEAALHAVKCGRKTVSQADFMEAVETVFAGKEKKDRVMSEPEKKLVAYHEVGHAVIAALSKDSSPVQKITIVPRTKGSLGYTLQVPDEEKYLSTKDEMLDEIRTLLGGRCAEEVFFDTITSGASNDIQRATEVARQMITIYGMSDRFDMMCLEVIQNKYLDGYAQRNCSEETSTIIDNEILEIIKKMHKEAKQIIEDNRALIVDVANFLIDKESITGNEFMSIFYRYYPERDKDAQGKSSRRTLLPRKKPLSVEKPPIPEIVEEPEPAVIEEPIKEVNIPKAPVQKEVKQPINDIPEIDDDVQEALEEMVEDIEVAEDIEEIEEPVKEAAEPQKAEAEPQNKVERPSASVLGPQASKKKKKKKKPASKATAEDMQNLLNSVGTGASTTKSEPEEKPTEEPKVEAVGKPPTTSPSEYGSNDDLDDYTEDLY